MARKRVDFTQRGFGSLPDDLPVVYRIETEGGKNNYTGVAQRGRVQERLTEHLPGGKDHVPGAKVQVEQLPNIDAARQREAKIIEKEQPKYNKQGR